ncbi:MAG: Rrf2 family transcriptional regulator [Nitrosomonas sp.]|uniref:Rrf2 family transcriptional regulator n=1 Tax=Nitrosomonas sp. TaxID=42353 RepID=UPI00255E5613|nr:Rrf2 family transcriptional regulator [Nitrosomonas sp.]MBE7526809.1 Rrf2 family transcriptional regulator [Burkholderiales bacterium]MCC6161473.1 Rrf2 family transcriptional regulator [Nitrosomonas sp.]MDL1866013.1 Rrf2 family transcriptional regulator [Betaproteobacteria bacterium PRO4]
MRLTNYSDYALRILTYLGLKKEELSTISEIASCYQISRNHIVKIVHQLGQLGYVDTLRGKNGGLRLARAPEEIKIGEVIRHTETMDIVECFGSQSACIIGCSCVLRTAISEALSAFMAVLDDYTLADLITPRRQLSKQLNVHLLSESLSD